MTIIAILLLLFSLFGFGVFGVFFLVRLIGKKGLPFKFIFIGFGAVFILFILSLIIFPMQSDQELASEKDKTVVKEVDAEKEAEEKAAEVAKEKAAKEKAEQVAKEQAEKAKKEQEEKEKAEKKKKEKEQKAKEKAKKEKKAKEKAEYVDTLQATLEEQMNTFDEAWETMWVPTFNGLSDGSVDIYTAYSNLKELKLAYDDLFIDVMDIRVSDHFTDKNSKLIQDFKNEFSVAVSFRSEGVSQAMDMIDLGNFSPSEMDAILDTIGLSDSAVLTAVSNKVTLDHNFDLLDNE